MEDRLAELKGRQGVLPQSDVKGGEELLPEFNKKINYIQYCMNKIQANNEQIPDLRAKHLKTTLAEQEKSISEEMNRIITENTKLCQIVKQELAIINQQAITAKEKEPHEPETRVMEITHRSMNAKFAELLKQFQTAQVNYKTAVKSKMERTVKVMDPTLTQPEIDDICNDPEGAQQLMASKIMGTGHIKLRHAVEDIKEKHKDIMRLERSVQTIHQMFVDIEMMVQEQGEKLDNIQINVENAENYMKKANVELKKAKMWHMRSKKITCCILLICVIIIVVAVAVPIVLKNAT